MINTKDILKKFGKDGKWSLKLKESLSRSVDALSPLIPYAFPAHSLCFPRSNETSGRELRRIWETSGKVICLCLILISYIVKSKFYSKRSRWGEIPRFTGKSPPLDLRFFDCTDFPCM